MVRILILFVALVLQSNLYAQNEGNIWYFGQNAGVDFNGATPIALTNGALVTGEGCATISDNTGTLLFYTDGIQVWNSNHVLMQNGTGLMGHSSSTQSAIIVKQPGINTLYYIFTVDATTGLGGLRYTIVDMSLNAGLGAVLNTSKNILLAQPTCEKITAISHSNGNDFWIVSHLYGSNTFVSYLLTAFGLITIPINSNTGTNISGSTSSTIGYIKASIDGTKIAVANWSINDAQLFDFDNSTGVVSNPLTFTNFTSGNPYGIEFSPNSKVLYISEAAGSNSQLLQYDLQAGSPTAIVNSRTTIATWGSYAGAVQLAPDQKIYQSRYGEEYLAVVNNPDVIGAGCNYVANGLYLGGKECRHGLPSFYNSIISPPPPFTFTDVCEGDSTAFLFNAVAMDSVKWNFGDPVSGINNTSVQFQPKHVFSDSGWFNVSLIAYFGMNVDTLIDSVYIYPLPQINLGNDTLLCTGDILLLDATLPGAGYLWANGSTNATYSVSQAGSYSVEVTLNGCSNNDTITIAYNSPPMINLGNDTSICNGGSLILNATIAGATYLWQNNSIGSTFTVNQSGSYFVEVTLNNCKASDSINVSYIPLPFVNIGSDTSICTGDNLVLNAAMPGASYAWQNNSSNASINANLPGIYWVDVTVNGCTQRDSISITNIPLPGVNLGNDTMLCQGDQLILDATLNGATYVWQNNSSTSMFNVIQPGTYWVEVTHGYCSNRDSIVIGYNPLPVFDLGNDTSICNGNALLLDVNMVNASYLWQNGSTSSQYSVTNAGNYWVQVTMNNCRYVDSILVSYKPNPNVNIGNDTVLCDGDFITLNAAQANASYLWNNNSTSANISVMQAGIYWVEVSVNNCSTLDSVMIDYDSVPVVDLGLDATVCYEESLTLNAEINDGFYLWNDLSTKPTYTINQPGLYWVEVGNHCGTDIDSIEVTFVDCYCYIYVPNAFSPNGDGTNDYFSPVSNCGFVEYRLQIFNRWGDLVFETYSPRETWDGSVSRTQAEQSSFVYFLTYQFPDSKRMMKSGNILLIR